MGKKEYLMYGRQALACLPPVGTTQDSGLLVRYITPRPVKWEIVAHRGGEAVLYDTSSLDQAEVYLMSADCFTTALVSMSTSTGESPQEAPERLLDAGSHR